MQYLGIGVPQNLEKAYNNFLIGAGKGHSESLAQIAECMVLGEGTKIDYEGALQYLKGASEAGSVRGMWGYGFRHLYGRVQNPNTALGFKLMQKASHGGELRAKSELAQCWEHGLEVVKGSPARAFELQKEAYDGGVKWGARNIGNYFERGFGVEQSLEKAAEVYRIVYENGGQEGIYTQGHYGMCLIRGRGVPENVKEGLKILRESCVENSTIGWNLLGDCYRYGYGVQRDANLAVYNYKQSTRANVGMRALSLAHESLGDMYEKGEGLPKSQDKAAFHFMFAADRHNHDAQMKIALMLESGIGLDKNIDRAVVYFNSSARGGNQLGQHKSVEYDLKGHGVEYPRTMDVGKIQEAAEQGHIGARNLLKKISKPIKRIISI